MNIKGQGRPLTLVQSHSDSAFSNFFSLETARPIEGKFHVEPPWDGEIKVTTTGLNHTASNHVISNIYNTTKMSRQDSHFYRVWGKFIQISFCA